MKKIPRSSDRYVTPSLKTILGVSIIYSDKGHIFMSRKHEEEISKPIFSPIFPKMCVL